MSDELWVDERAMIERLKVDGHWYWPLFDADIIRNSTSYIVEEWGYDGPKGCEAFPLSDIDGIIKLVTSWT